MSTRSRRMWFLYAPAFFIALALLVHAIFDGSIRGDKPVMLDAGSTFYEIDINSVASFTYKFDGNTVRASRSKPDGFLLSVEHSDGRPPEKCRASDPFNTALRRLLKIEVIRQGAPGDVDQYSNELGTIEIQNDIADEAPDIFSFRSDKENPSVLAVSGPYFFETKIPLEAFKNIGLGCLR